VLARGETTLEKLDSIHQKMETLLGLEGAYLDGIYVCPHHPHRGFPGEVPELKIDCTCRKPKPGLLLKAAEEYSIDLAKSWMVGDSLTDMQAGRAAGCRCACILRKEGKSEKEFRKPASGTEDFVCVDSLLEFTERYL
jgi:D-glycero-D-manno-heptose 1,7-bisphosphate phosphatase